MPPQGDTIGREIHRLATFIRLNIDPIVAEWISFAQTREPVGGHMTRLGLKDHVVEILQVIAKDLETPQTDREQVAKSRGQAADPDEVGETPAEVHAALRLTDGFDIDQMVSEYRALRASVIKQWIASHRELALTDIEDMIRFNEAIDQAMAESVARYTKVITSSRNLFLGILGHDLRNPISAALMAAQRMVSMGAPEARQTFLASQIVKATERGLTILNDLLEITRSSFGMDMPVFPKAVDIGRLGAALTEEMQSIAGDRTLAISIQGDTIGECDEARIGQALSNLIGNAIQYSRPASTILVTVAGDEKYVHLSVKNDGTPIPHDKLAGIFGFMTRGDDAALQSGRTGHLGLGLYIARSIIAAHGGDLNVSSSETSGTVFTAQLPRRH